MDFHLGAIVMLILIYYVYSVIPSPSGVLVADHYCIAIHVSFINNERYHSHSHLYPYYSFYAYLDLAHSEYSHSIVDYPYDETLAHLALVHFHSNPDYSYDVKLVSMVTHVLLAHIHSHLNAYYPSYLYRIHLAPLAHQVLLVLVLVLLVLVGQVVLLEVVVHIVD